MSECENLNCFKTCFASWYCVSIVLLHYLIDNLKISIFFIVFLIASAIFNSYLRNRRDATVVRMDEVIIFKSLSHFFFLVEWFFDDPQDSRNDPRVYLYGQHLSNGNLNSHLTNLKMCFQQSRKRMNGGSCLITLRRH